MATAYVTDRWSGVFRDQNTPTLTLTGGVQPRALLVVTYGGRDHTGDKTPAGFSEAVQSTSGVNVGIFYKITDGTETSVQLGAGTTPSGTGRAFVSALLIVSSTGWSPVGPQVTTALGVSGTSTVSVGPVTIDINEDHIAVAAWGGADDVTYASLTTSPTVSGSGQTAPTPPIVPEGIILGWSSTAASIPSGWTRVTALDGRYVKSIPDAVTAPGTTGGSATHSHTTDSHTHSISHAHTQAAANSADSATTENLGGTGSGARQTHAHALSTNNTSTANINSGTGTPDTSSASNELDVAELIWIESNGTSEGADPDVIGLAVSALTDWSDYATATDRFLKGATGDGGGTANTGLTNHNHSINAHAHSGSAHTHTSSSTGQATGSLVGQVGTTGAVPRISNIHAHSVNVTSASAALLTTASGGDTGNETPSLPPWLNVRALQNTSVGQSLPTGLIGLWLDALGSIPTDWVLCDGNNSTPNLLTRYPRCVTTDVGTTGGSSTAHVHTGGSHTHSTSGHDHPRTLNAATASLTTSTGAQAYHSSGHTHTASNTDSATPTVANSAAGTLSSTSSEPPFTEVAFIQWQGTIAPAGDEGTGAVSVGAATGPTVTAQATWTGGGELRGALAIFTLGGLRGSKSVMLTRDPKYVIGGGV